MLVFIWQKSYTRALLHLHFEMIVHDQKFRVIHTFEAIEIT